MIDNTNRKFLHPLSELIDRLTITEIKLVISKKNKDDLKNEVENIIHDIELILQEKNIKLDAKFIRQIIILSQLNLHIWNNKDKMQDVLEEDQKYMAYLKMAHQLNGYRNQIKNKLLTIENINDESQLRDNTEVDGLDFNFFN